MRLHKNEKGFTFLELILFVTILGIILGLSWPKLDSSFKYYKLRSSASLIVSDIRLIQQLSIGEGIWYKIKFDPVNNRYFITRNINEGSLAQTYKIVNLEQDVQLYSTNFPDNAIYFYSTGNPSQGGTISITDGKEKYLYIIISPVTGRCRLSNLPPY